MAASGRASRDDRPAEHTGPTPNGGMTMTQEPPAAGPSQPLPGETLPVGVPGPANPAQSDSGPSTCACPCQCEEPAQVGRLCAGCNLFEAS